MPGKVFKLLMDADRPASEGTQGTSFHDARFVGLVRDAMIVGMLAIIAWTVSEIHNLSNDFSAVKANHVTQEQKAEMENHLRDMIAEVAKANTESFRTLSGQLTQIAGSTGEIKGKLDAIAAVVVPSKGGK